MPRSASESWADKFWPSLAAIVLGMSLARWAWILFAPSSMAVLPSAEITASEDAEKLFGAGTSLASGSSAVVLPGARLVGVFAPTTHNTTASASKNSIGFAIIQLDEKHQTGVALGGEVAPGVKLHEIHADHVVLERDGVTQLIKLEGLTPKENPAGKQASFNTSPVTTEQSATTTPGQTSEIRPVAGMPGAPGVPLVPRPLQVR